MEKKWWHTSVIYQIYPRSFMDSNNDGIGDLKGIISKLPYLQNLGIDVIWLSPVYKSPMKDNGYDISDYEDIDPIFGDLKDLETLINCGKAHGIKILMDLVVNHTSNQHKWFLESKKSKDNPYRDYYIWRDSPSNLGSTFGGSAWEYDKNTNQYYYHNFAVEQPDLNWENPQILEEICLMINNWLEKGIGGFRLDVIDLIGKEIDKGIFGNGPKLHPLLKELSSKTFSNYDIMTVGETWGATPEIATLYSAPERQELSMIFQFEHMVLDWGNLGKWTPIELDFLKLKMILSKWQKELVNGWNSLFWNNHDLPRIVSRWGNDKTYRLESAKMLAITLHMMKGTPYIYQGEEIGMTNVKFNNIEDYNDVEIHGFYNDYVLNQKLMSHEDFMNGVYKMGRDNARTPFQWSNCNEAGFTEGTPWLKINPNYTEINAEEALNNKNSIFFTYQKLIALRKNSVYTDTILYGDYELLLDNDPNIFAYKRLHKNQEILVLSNFTVEIVPINLSLKNYDILHSNYIDFSFNLMRPFESVILVIYN
mgnify:CR=1 FL=1